MSVGTIGNVCVDIDCVRAYLVIMKTELGVVVTYQGGVSCYCSLIVEPFKASYSAVVVAV